MAYRSVARTTAGTTTPFIALLHVLRDLLHVGVRFLNRSVPKRTLLIGGLLALSLTTAFAASDLVKQRFRAARVSELRCVVAENSVLAEFHGE